MGCKNSSHIFSGNTSPAASVRENANDAESSSPVFGSGVHIGRSGNVDLSRRDLDVLGPQMVNMIMEDDLHRTATSLTLSNNRLYALAKELPVLANLRELDIDSNRFQRFPEVLVRLPRLWRINASFNPLDVSRGFDVLPRLISLRSLTVQNCGLKEIPLAVTQCEVLEELDVGYNTDIKIAGAALHRLARLRKLGVANCNLSGRTLPSTIKRMRLTSLDISGNAFTFADPTFFGHNLPRSLVELRLVGMNLSGPPVVVALLKRLNFLDLAENPIETLDVLAGRVVKRFLRPPSNGTVATTCTNTSMPGDEAEGGLDDDETASIASGVGGAAASATTSRVSLSKVSRAGIVSHVSQPIPLKRLSLRCCNFRTVPKYFHKLDHLEELDLSENEHLDDPNMTLFSLRSLVTLNVVGCPFAEDLLQSRNEWFDISKLRDLRNIQWEVWKSEHNMSPYRTKIPIELCALQLHTLNEVRLRKNLFTGDITETVINLLSDGYFKVDLSVDEMILHSHMAAIKALAECERFFFPKVVTDTPNITSDIDPASLGQVHLRIAVNRYIFFLAMQAANYDAVIIPPLDVMVIHYAQLTVSPLNYRTDCEAVCGRILNCNYRTFFAEQGKHQAEAKSVVDTSRRIWNLMVRSAQRDLAWLRYDFWDKRLRASAAAAAAAGSAGNGEGAAPVGGNPSLNSPGAALSGENTTIFKTLPLLGGTTADEVAQDWQTMRSIDSASDLAGVLDAAITSHFSEKGVEEFATSVRQFFSMNHCFLRNEGSLWKAGLDWNRYVKFLTLYAYRCALLEGNSTYVMEPVADEEGNLVTPVRTTSRLGKHYDTMENYSFEDSRKYLPKPLDAVDKMPLDVPLENDTESVSPLQNGTTTGIPRRSVSTLLRASRSNKRLAMVRQLEGNPVPTIGIAFMLHAHRTSHLKYYQSLSLFAIENIDVAWGDAGDHILKQMQGAWMALYDEAYVSENKEVPFSYLVQNGVLMPTTARGYAADTVAESRPVTAKGGVTSSTVKQKLQYTFEAKAVPRVSCIKTRNRKADNTFHRVTFCSADTELGVF
ncbi:hypothetical protein JKF63_07166 [Porcisia hertigi]|uniref:Uncharacterized protein n=1 Tax=Porcisia hertigi TaxID=2761500 RepID=A0A836LKG2_9TRYP|nr:hypothetical protein JKF63_07166 [Porcisia hertigi]